MADAVETDPYERWKQLGRPGGSFQAWQAQQGGAPAPEVTGQPASAPVSPLALTLQALQGRAAATGASEDWTRFQQGDVDRWSPFYDAASGRFRSSRGAEGLFDKPTECPPGMGPSGPNETDPCTSVGYGGGNQPQAAMSGAQPAAMLPQVPAQPTVPTAGVQASAAPLQTVMAGLQTSPGIQAPSFMSGGTSSLQNLMAALPTQSTAQSGTQFQGGLTNMMARKNRSIGSNTQRWFA